MVSSDHCVSGRDQIAKGQVLSADFFGLFLPVLRKSLQRLPKGAVAFSEVFFGGTANLAGENISRRETAPRLISFLSFSSQRLCVAR